VKHENIIKVPVNNKIFLLLKFCLIYVVNHLELFSLSSRSRLDDKLEKY
jgi:hypothetical protein